MKAMDHQDLFDKVWQYLINLMKAEAAKSNETQVAKRIGVHPTTVGRWLKGDRGEGIKLSECLKIVLKLGGTMAGMAREIGYEEAAMILELLDEDQQFMLGILEIMQRGGPEAEKLKYEVSFLRKSIADRKE